MQRGGYYDIFHNFLLGFNILYIYNIYLCYLYGPGSNSTLIAMSTTRSQIFSYKFQTVQDDPGIAHCSKK